MKIAVTPAVVAIEAVFYAKTPSRQALGATMVLLAGVTLATVTDQQVEKGSGRLERLLAG